MEATHQEAWLCYFNRAISDLIRAGVTDEYRDAGIRIKAPATSSVVERASVVADAAIAKLVERKIPADLWPEIMDGKRC